MRIERNETGRRSPWPPFRRSCDLELTLPLRSIDDLFTAPDLDPFSPDYETYGEKPGIETIADVLHAEQGVRQVEAILELPPGAIDPALAEGVYAGLPGPHYETAAEITMLRTLGADLVGMSTVHETIAARAAGVEVLGISLVTNMAAGLTGEPIRHEEVLEAGRQSATGIGALLAELLATI